MSLGHLFGINIIVIVCLLTIGILFIVAVMSMVNGLKEKRAANNSRITIKAKIVGKRTSLYSAIKRSEQVIYNNSAEDSCYYITFQLEDGRRDELRVSAKDYGIIMVGENGLLVTEETKFIEFKKDA